MHTPGAHPVHDTQIKRLRHLNLFQYECFLELRVPRVRLPNGKVYLVGSEWVGRLDGFTLLFQALTSALRRQMSFAAVRHIVNLSRTEACDLRVARGIRDLEVRQPTMFDCAQYLREHGTNRDQS
jgi:transposase